MMLKYSIIGVIICIILSTMFIYVYRTKEYMESDILLKIGLFLYGLAIAIALFNFGTFLVYRDIDEKAMLHLRTNLIIDLENLDKYEDYEDKVNIINDALSFNDTVLDRRKKVNDKWLSCYIRDYWKEDTIQTIDIKNIDLEVKYNNDIK